MAGPLDDRLKYITTIGIGVAGIVMSIAVFFVASTNISGKGRDYEEIEFRLRRMERLIFDIDDRLRLLEKRANPGSSSRLVLPIAETTTAPAASVTPVAEEKKGRIIFRDYIFPSIYGVLGLLLLASAITALATNNKDRKETAAEISKTLMTFFIGAATGQV